MKPGRWTRKGRPRQPIVWLAFTASTLAVVLGGLFLALVALNSRDPEVSTYEYWGADAVTAMVFPAVGALIVSRYPRNTLGWLFCLMGLSLGLAGFASEYATYALVAEPGSLPGAKVAAWLGSWIGIPGFLSLVLIPLLFPDGSPPSRRWWPLVWLAAGFIAAATVSITLIPGPLEGYPSVENPFGVQGARAANESLFFAANPILGLTLLAGIASLVIRYRRSRGEERQQVKWFTFAVVLAPFGLVGNTLFPDLAWLIGGVSASLIPLAIGIAVLRYRLYDIDLVINRTLVYGVLTACVVGIYVMAVGYLGALFRTGGNLAISLVATGLVAVLFAPLRDRLQRGVNRLMYGERDDPYAVLSGLGQRLEAALAPDAVLPALVETVRETLRLPYAAVALDRGGASNDVAASAGEPGASPLRLPLRYGNEQVGELLLGRRAGEEEFSDADRRLFGDLARQAGVAVHAVRLTADLQRSRERLVTAREEERRRLRRDLHDGLGAQLAGLNVQAGVLRNLIPRDPEAADGMVVELKEELRAAIGDIRRLVHDLRPPALDDLGLVGALERLAERYGAEGEGLRVTVGAPEELPPLPAAVEVAVYRVVQEALTNVVRHAGARECEVHLAVSDGLRLEVSDDGVGTNGAHDTGVGLLSMRERAAELGGAFALEPSAKGGTRVLIYLPLTGG